MLGSIDKLPHPFKELKYIIILKYIINTKLYWRKENKQKCQNPTVVYKHKTVIL